MKIDNIEFVTSAVRRSQYPTDKLSEFLIIGRSNVGKSSFINTITNRKNLARTSSIPGKTQTINFYLVNNTFYLVDIPGYGFARVSQKLKNKFGVMIEDYLQERDNLKMVFLLIDFRHKPTDDDILMYNYLKYYDIPVTVVATKSDKVSKNNYSKNLKLLEDSFVIDEANIILFSSQTKVGKQDIHQKIEEML